VDCLREFDSRVNNTVAMFEEGRQFSEADVAVFVDRCPDDGAAMLAIPGRVIRSPTEKGNSKWGSAHDHRLNSIALFMRLAAAVANAGVSFLRCVVEYLYQISAGPYPGTRGFQSIRGKRRRGNEERLPRTPSASARACNHNCAGRSHSISQVIPTRFRAP